MVCVCSTKHHQLFAILDGSFILFIFFCVSLSIAVLSWIKNHCDRKNSTRHVPNINHFICNFVCYIQLFLCFLFSHFHSSRSPFFDQHFSLSSALAFFRLFCSCFCCFVLWRFVLSFACRSQTLTFSTFGAVS